MGVRDVSGLMLRSCFGSVRKDVTKKKLLDWVLEEMASCQKDADITGDVDALNYYEGMIDAFEMVAKWIAPLKPEKQKEYCELLSKVVLEAKVPA